MKQDDELPGNSRKQKLLGLDLPSNSDKVKREQAQIESVLVKRKVSGKIIKKSQSESLGAKFARTFLGGDAQKAGEYIVGDVLIPALKSMISDMVTGGIETILFGDRQSGSSSRGGKPRMVSYTNYYQNQAKREEPRRFSRPKTGKLDQLYVETRRDGDIVLETLDNIMEEFRVVTVADLLTTMELESDYTDNKYGWTTLKDTSVTRTPDGYKINVPRPKALD